MPQPRGPRCFRLFRARPPTGFAAVSNILGPFRLSDSEAAQHEIAEIPRRPYDRGRISLPESAEARKSSSERRTSRCRGNRQCREQFELPANLRSSGPAVLFVILAASGSIALFRVKARASIERVDQ